MVETPVAGDRGERARVVARVQGVYFLVTGVWPFLSRATFEAVTGPKLEYWLVLTVGGLVAAAGVVLLAAARERRIVREIALLGVMLPIVLALLDFYAVPQPRTSRAYWADAVVELALVAAWSWAWPKRRPDGRET